MFLVQRLMTSSVFVFQYYEMSYGLNIEMHKQVSGWSEDASFWCLCGSCFSFPKKTPSVLRCNKTASQVKKKRGFQPSIRGKCWVGAPFGGWGLVGTCSLWWMSVSCSSLLFPSMVLPPPTAPLPHLARPMPKRPARLCHSVPCGLQCCFRKVTGECCIGNPRAGKVLGAGRLLEGLFSNRLKDGGTGTFYCWKSAVLFHS